MSLNYKIVIAAIITSILLPQKINAFSNNWEEIQAMPYETASNYSFFANNNIYSISGSNTDYVPYTFSYNTQTGNSWNVTVSPTTFWHTGANNDEYVYILGGAVFPPLTSSNKVFYSNLNPSQNLSFSQTTSLPRSLWKSNAFINHGKIYIAGGQENDSTFSDKIYASIVTQTGELSDWESMGELPEEISSFGLIKNNDYLYVLGGRNADGISRKVWRGVIKDNGQIEDWQQLPNLPYAVERSNFVISNNTIFILGGITDTSGVVEHIWYSNIDTDGFLNQWVASNSQLPRPDCCSSSFVHDENIYIIGGHDGAYYFDTVYKSKISQILNEILEDKLLNVNLIKQTSLPWANKIYDSANIWSPSSPSISTWGCAITSMSMLFSYYGLNILPDKTPVDPGNLNNYLKNIPTGYVRGGNVNWVTLAAMTKKMKQSGLNPNFTHNALEFSYQGSDINNAIKDSIGNDLPVIINTPGHFVVGTGLKDGKIKINDPLRNYNFLSDGYALYESIREFIPSNTDLSYIMIQAPVSVDISLMNNSNEIGEEHVEYPIFNSNNNQPSGEPTKIIYLKKPQSGEYGIKISSLNSIPYWLDIYLYDIEGNVIKEIRSGYLSKSNNTYLIKFNKSTTKKSSIRSTLSIQNMINDINYLLTVNQINKTLGKSLITILKNSERNVEKNKIVIAKGELLTVKIIIDSVRSSHILLSQNGYKLLYSDIDLLLNP